ncbi:2-oxoglutarate dehydrogenase E1 subunit family protein, partial [Streptomyces rimosus]
MSPQSPNSSSTSTDQEGQGKNPAAAFGPNEWLVDEIYQQYLQDPNSVDRAWWDFFADYKPGAGAAAPAAASDGPPATPASGTGQAAQAAAPSAPAAPARPAQQQP